MSTENNDDISGELFPSHTHEGIIESPGTDIEVPGKMAEIGENQLPPTTGEEFESTNSEVEHAGLVDQEAKMTESRTINPVGSPATMSKRRVLLNYQTQTETIVYFGDAEGQDGLNMPKDVWEDLGSPQVVTVGVVPRDILN